MKTISMIAAAALLGASANVLAGEDSTDHWGAGGTGPAWYQTQCGLEHFPGPSVETPKPCTETGRHYQTSDAGRVPTRVQSLVATGPVNDGHGGRKKPESRK